MHQDLAIDAEHIKQSDIGFADRFALFRRQLIGREHRVSFSREATTQLGIAVELIEHLLDVIEAHRGKSKTPQVAGATRTAQWRSTAARSASVFGRLASSPTVIGFTGG